MLRRGPATERVCSNLPSSTSASQTSWPVDLGTALGTEGEDVDEEVEEEEDPTADDELPEDVLLGDDDPGALDETPVPELGDDESDPDDPQKD